MGYLDARKKRSVGPLIPFSTVKMEDIDYGKTKIAYPESRKKRTVTHLGWVPIKAENVDYGKTKIAYPESRRKRSVRVIHPAPISMANIDYGKTKITYL